jgi:hypothetical protein
MKDNAFDSSCPEVADVVKGVEWAWQDSNLRPHPYQLTKTYHFIDTKSLPDKTLAIPSVQCKMCQNRTIPGS